MNNNEIDYKALLAEARAIHFAMQNRALTYEQAKERTKPILDIVNRRIKFRAKQQNVSPKLVKFQDLGRTL